MAKRLVRKTTKKRVKKLIKNLIKPSRLPKDLVTSIRINSTVKRLLKDDGITIQALLDEAIDRRLSKVEFEKKITYEEKK